MSAENTPADSLLLAQQYLLGELSPAEAAAFESRLAEEPELALALADTVLIHDALSGGVPARSVPGESRQTRQRVKRFWWGAAAAVAVGAVALVLPETGSNLVSVDRPEVYETLFSADDEPDAPELAEAEADPREELDVPDWMMAALEAAGHGGRKEIGAPQEEEL